MVHLICDLTSLFVGGGTTLLFKVNILSVVTRSPELSWTSDECRTRLELVGPGEPRPQENRSPSYPHVDVGQTHLEFIILKIIKSLLMRSTLLLFNGFIKYAYCFTALL